MSERLVRYIFSNNMVKKETKQINFFYVAIGKKEKE